jgi:hypothetical protein
MKARFLHASVRHCAAVVTALLFTTGSGTSSQGVPNLFPVFPNTREGNTFSTIPFSTGSSTVRFQQLFDFQGLTIAGYSGPFLINSVSFRIDAGRPGFGSVFPDFQLSISTTANSVDGLSAIFSDNVGTDSTGIVPRGSFTYNANSVGQFSPIFLATPFYYDPSQGNLLLDFRNFGGGTTSYGQPPFTGPAYVDAASVLGDRVSSLFANDVNAASGTSSTLGLVTGIGITPVPEPSTWTLLGVGLVALVFNRKRLKKSKGGKHVAA